MIRWTYAGPRLAVLAVVGVAAAITAPRLVRRTVTGALEQLTGAPADVEFVRFSWLRGELQLRGVTLCDPADSGRPLAAAGAARLRVRVPELLRQRVVVQRAELQGLDIDADAAGWSQLGPQRLSASPPPGWRPSGGAGGIDRWLAAAAGRAGAAAVEQLESVRLVRELRRRWTNEYAGLEARSRGVAERLEELERALPVKRRNPLQEARRAEEAAVQLEAIRNELASLGQALERLGRQAERDRRAVEQAARADAQRLRRLAELGSLPPDELTEALLGDEARRRVAAVLQWAAWARRLAAGAPAPARGRGVDVALGRNEPRVLFRWLAVDGRFWQGGEPLPFQAVLRDAASPADRHDSPLRLRLRTGGQTPLAFEATIDRRQGRDWERVVLAAPRVPLGESLWGDPQRLALAVPAGWLRLEATLVLDGQRVDGVVWLEREGPPAHVRLGPDYDAEVLREAAEGAAAQLNCVAARVRLTGRVDAPRFAVQSEVGRQLAAAMQTTIRRRLAERRDLLAAQLNETLSHEWNQLDVLAAGHQARIRRLLAPSDEQADRLTRRIASLLGLPEGLGRAKQLLLYRR